MSPHLAATLNVAPAAAGENSAKHDFHNSIEIFSTQNLLVCCRQQHWWQRLVLEDEIDIFPSPSWWLIESGGDWVDADRLGARTN